GRWRFQEHRRDDHHNALEKPPFDKGRLVSLAVDHVGDGCNCKCSPCAEPGSRESCGQTAMVREPLESDAYCGAIDNACAYARERIPQIKSADRLGSSAAPPTHAGEHAAERNQKSRAKFVHQPALKGNQPGFKQHKNCDGDLDDCRLHAEVFMEGLDE